MEDVRLRTRRVKAITGFADGSAYYIVFGMAAEVRQSGVQIEKLTLCNRRGNGTQ